MKHINLDREALGAAYAPMDERFEYNMRTMIAGLPSRSARRPRVRTLRIAVAFALILAALTATALAAYAVRMVFIEDVAALHKLASEYDQWTLKEKEALAASMMENSVLDDAAEWMDALEIRNDKMREKALDALFALRYGINGRTDTITAVGIVEAELGMYDNEWSLEQKAQYSGLMMDMGFLGWDTMVDLLPGKGVIAQEEAERIAREAVCEAFHLTQEQMRAYDANLFYGLHRTELGGKEPYYTVELYGAGLELQRVYVSADGRILGERDGYIGVISPEESALLLDTKRIVEEIPEDERAAAHAAVLPELQADIVSREGRIVDGVVGSREGMVMVYGRMSGGFPAYTGVFCELMEVDGQERWMLALQNENGEEYAPKAMMECEDGSWLLMIERKKPAPMNGLDYMRYDQLRISRDGALLDRMQLDPIGELTGMGGREEQMFAEAGHGGMLVSGYMGGRYIPVYAQLNEEGEALFTWSFEEYLGMAPYLKVTNEGYMLCAWDEAGGRSILRAYDKQGQPLSDGETMLTGMRVNRVSSCGDGSMMAASLFMEDGMWQMARLDGQGRLLEMMEYRDSSGRASWISQIVRAGAGYAYAASHLLSPEDEQHHLGLIMTDEHGTIREYRISGVMADAMTSGYVYLASAGERVLLMAYTMIDDTQRPTAHYALIELPHQQ